MSPRRQHHFFQIGYSFAELGVSSIESFLRLYLLIFLTSSIGLDADLAGYAVSIGILWDAFADPIMGKISDRTNSRWGQRLPWMVLGTPILALSFVQIFKTSPISAANSSTWVFIEITLLNILLNTAMTMVSVPHMALGNELSPSLAGDRTTVYAWRSAMTLLGFLVGILIPAVINATGLTPARPEYIFSVVIAVITIITVGITIGTCKTRLAPSQGNLKSPSMSPRLILRDGVGHLMLAFFVATLAQGFNSAIAMYYYRFSLELDDQAIGKILIVFIGSLCSTIPLWVFLSQRAPKSKIIAISTIGLGIAGSVFYPLFSPGQLAGPYAMAVFGGILLGSSGLLESLLVDTAENQGLPPDVMGLVFGLWKFMAKSSRALAIALGGKLLTMIGYAPGASLSSEVRTGISWLFGPGVGMFFIVAGLILVFPSKKSTSNKII